MKRTQYIALLLTTLAFMSVPLAYTQETGFLEIGVEDQHVEVPAEICVKGPISGPDSARFYDSIRPPYPYRIDLEPGHYSLEVNYTNFEGFIVTAGWTQIWIRSGETRQCAVGTYKFPREAENPWFILRLQELWKVLEPFWWWILVILLLFLLFLMLAKDKKKKKPK